MPTFGKTTNATGFSASTASRVWVSPATPSTSGTVQTGHARLRLNAAGSVNVRFAIYADDGGEPGDLLATSDIISITSTTEAERVFTFSGVNRITVEEDTPYWIGPAWQAPVPSGASAGLEVSRDGDPGLRREQAVSWPDPPDPYGEPLNTTSGPIDAWVTYVEGSPEVFGSGSAAFTFTAAANGLRETFGSGSADLGFSASASVPTVVTGSGSAAFAFSAHASGQVIATPGTPFFQKHFGQGGRLLVEIAWGADLQADSGTWTWTDITKDLRNDPGISTRLGRGDEASTSQPAQCSMTLNNTGGKYSIGGHSPNWPYVRRNVPVRVSIDPNDSNGSRPVFFGFADGFTPGWDSLTGKIPVVELSASGTLRRLQQGDAPIPSAYRRAMTNLDSVVAYWPMEEGRDATYAPDVRGGSDMVIMSGFPEWGSDDSFNCSAPLPLLKDAYLRADLEPYTVDTGENQVRFLLRIPENQADGTVIAHIFTSGSIARFDITYEIVNGGPCLGVFRYFDSGNLQGSTILGFDILDVIGRLSIGIDQRGDDAHWGIAFKDALTPEIAVGFDATIADETVGIVTRIDINPHGHLGDFVFGHLTVQNIATSVFEETDELVAKFGEFASSSTLDRARLERLCAENNVHVTRYTSLVGGAFVFEWDMVGPQLPKPLLELLREAETVDQGQLWDGRTAGLAYTTRRYRESGEVALTLNAQDLFGSFTPVDDDQRNRNRVTCSRLQGISGTYEDVDGPLGTDTIGYYDSSLTVNAKLDEMALQFAAWQVHLGTVEGYRYPSVTLNMNSSPDLAADVLDIIPGARINIENLDDTLVGFPMGTVSMLVEGITHEITNKTWTVTFQCSPWSPWGIGRVAEDTGDTSEFLLRLDTSGSTLASSASQGATSISVTTSSGPLWTTTADDYPLTLSVGGIPVIATGCSDATSPQTISVQALPLARSSGAEVKLYDPRPLGLG